MAIRKVFLNIAALALLALLLAAANRWGDEYQVRLLNNIAVFIILAVSYNLINGVCGQLHLGPNAFIALGAYTAALLTLPPAEKAANFLITPLYWPLSQITLPFPLALLAGGLVAAACGFLTGFPVFRVRGDYLAIVTLAFNMIVKSVLENLEVVGGPRGFLGMPRLTNLFWVAAWVLITVMVLRRLVYSNFGRGITAIREDEVAANLTGVDTRRVKLYAFLVSAFFAGVAGGLFAHLLQFINPRSFSILKSTDMLVMVYLGGVGSLTGSLLGATIFTLLMEVLRPLGLWRWVVGPLLLVLLMIFRPQGIMGFKEWKWFKERAVSSEQ